jgi:hypothetical protein
MSYDRLNGWGDRSHFLRDRSPPQSLHLRACLAVSSAVRSRYNTQAPRLLRGRGQVPLRHAVRIGLGEALSSRSAYISTLIWGLAVGFMCTQSAPAPARPYILTGCMVISAAIGFTSMIPWRWRLVPRRTPFYVALGVNGAVALAMGVALFWLVILGIGLAMEGMPALRPHNLLAVFKYALYGFQFPLIGFYIALGTDLAHRATVQAKERQRFERVAEQARLVALRSQINPHFFFNALNTIAALIPRRPADAERAVELLATALRPVLSGEQSMTATLASELEVARAYSAIEALRLGDRCEFHTDVQPEALSCKLPALSLQPLIENAVRHGAAHCSGKYIIALRAHVDRQLLRLLVVNHPVGKDTLMHEAAAVTSTPGHALHNIRQRLKLQFGATADLQVRSAENFSGSAEMTVPQNARRGVRP